MNKSAIIYLTEYCRAPILDGKRSRVTYPINFHVDFDSFSLQTNEIFEEEDLKNGFVQWVVGVQ